MASRSSFDLPALVTPGAQPPAAKELDRRIGEALQAWLLKSPYPNTRASYSLDLGQFLAIAGIPPEHRGLAAVLARVAASCSWQHVNHPVLGHHHNQTSNLLLIASPQISNH